MPNGEEWLYRPVMRGMCKAESLLDGSLSLADIAEFNAAIEVEQENIFRAEEAAKRNAK